MPCYKTFQIYKKRCAYSAIKLATLKQTSLKDDLWGASPSRLLPSLPDPNEGHSNLLICHKLILVHRRGKLCCGLML
ncbi:hypothetical protein CEXT_813521 [Caerostris extrusa]|uniref:Uncharacterized protein n=1 Tax=Caerostris extrusa TaxID=172846 RepID=A0AAV4U0K4_CAEEX|nr:hypothetical protein CEXT_813521 [Caerostris extrusa]